jgi:hypothetical protein
MSTKIRELVPADAIGCVDQQDANIKEVATMEEQINLLYKFSLIHAIT